MTPRVNGARVAARGAATPWWSVPGATCVAAYQPKGAADLAASYVNLANPGTYNAAPGVAPTIGADGWIFDGATQWLDTGIVPVTAGQTWSIIARIGNASISRDAMATASAGATFFGLGKGSGGFLIFLNGFTLASTSGAAGVYAAVGASGYLNGSVQAGTIGTGTDALLALVIGARRTAPSTIARFWDSTIAAIAIYSDNPATVAANIAALTTRMQAL